MSTLRYNYYFYYTGLGFATEDDLVSFAMAENETTQQMWGGICFTSEFPNGHFSKQIHYKVHHILNSNSVVGPIVI